MLDVVIKNNKLVKFTSNPFIDKSSNSVNFSTNYFYKLFEMKLITVNSKLYIHILKLSKEEKKIGFNWTMREEANKTSYLQNYLSSKFTIN